MSIKASDLISTICSKIGIPRGSERMGDQFLNKQELLHILAHIDKQEMHIASLKREVDEGRNLKAMAMAIRAQVNQEIASND